MQDRCKQALLPLLFGCLACLAVTSVVNADGRVFVLNLRNSTGLHGFRDAERACVSLHARLATSAELRHAVVECFFSICTRGWLYGGTVGTTVCNIVGSALKAVDVTTENATEDTAHLDAFCIKDKGVPCGDPPSFPNARLQGHSGFEMGDELQYICVPGYVMPSGHRAFSLLCDSCGEWYGLVEICVKDEKESHIDYEDKFTDSYGEAEHQNKRPEEAHGEVYEEVHGASYQGGKMSQEHQETSFSVEKGHQDQQREHEMGGEVTTRKFERVVEGEKGEERAVEDFVGHPMWEQEQGEVTNDVAAATEAPVSLLSQKHLFWFPSEAFQEEGHSVSISPVTEITQRTSGVQSEESIENESQERQHHQNPIHPDDHDHQPDNYDDHDTDDQDDHADNHHDNQDDHDSHQEEDEHDDHLTHYIPAQHDDLDRRGRYENQDDHDDHYDMGEHEEDRGHIRGSQEFDERDDEHESYEDHEDVTEDHGDDDQNQHPDGSEEHQNHDDHNDSEEHYDHEEDNNDHDTDHDDHEHDDHDSYHDSHEDVDDGPHHIIFSIGRGDHLNSTQKGEGGKATTDDTWLDGYPVVAAEVENGDSTTERFRPKDRERGAVAKITDKPNEVDIRQPVPYTSFPRVPESTMEPSLEQGRVEEMWPGFIHTAAPSPDRSQPSDSPSDTDAQQAAPTPSLLGDLTQHPFIDHDPAPPVHDGNILIEEHTMHNLPGESGERGEMEGEMGETICEGENCPPASSGRGPKVAAIIAVVCVIATAVIVGVWCYRRQQQKSSVYEMNGKGQSQTRPSQQIEMQQKV